MNILLKPHANKVFYNNNIFRINTGDNIFYNFDKRLKKLGINVSTIDIRSKNFEKIVFTDVPYFWEIEAWKLLLTNKKKSILFTFESPLVAPHSHRRIFYIFFHKVITWNDNLVDNRKIVKFLIPSVSQVMDKKKVSFKKKKLVNIINSNKSFPFPFLMLSPFKKDLYPERIKLIKYFEEKEPEQFSLYGRGWNSPKKFSIKEAIFGYHYYKSYRGMVPRTAKDKIDVLSKYKFNLCLENCVAEGYISEKIIDCFKAKCVPIYYGSPNISNYIPKNCFIDYRNFNSIEKLHKFIKGISEPEYNKYLDNSAKLLKDKNFNNKWFEKGFEETFLKAIDFVQ